MIDVKTAPTPAEPTTPIKPSEALRLGRLLRPDGTPGYIFKGTTGACAIGAIAAGYGIEKGDIFADYVYEALEKFMSSDLIDEVWTGYDYEDWTDDEVVRYLQERGL